MATAFFSSIEMKMPVVSYLLRQHRNVYPDPTKSIPPATVGPELPERLAGTTFTVLTSCRVLYSHRGWPSVVETRNIPSIPTEKTTPGIAVRAAVCPPPRYLWARAMGVNHFFSPVVNSMQATPLVLKPKYAFSSARCPAKRNHAACFFLNESNFPYHCPCLSGS